VTEVPKDEGGSGTVVEGRGAMVVVEVGGDDDVGDGGMVVEDEAAGLAFTVVLVVVAGIVLVLVLGREVVELALADGGAVVFGGLGRVAGTTRMSPGWIMALTASLFALRISSELIPYILAIPESESPDSTLTISGMTSLSPIRSFVGSLMPLATAKAS
jgi:hypothetical protein